MNGTLEDRVNDLPGLINILRADPNEWHDYRIQLPETSLVFSMQRHLIGYDMIATEEWTYAIWKWSLKWVSLTRLQAVMHGDDRKYQQPETGLPLIAFLEALWLGLEMNSEAEIDASLKGLRQ